MLEDGELSGSDSDMTPSTRPPPADRCTASPGRAARPPGGYRSAARPADSSDSGGDSDDDEAEAAWRCKRQKVSSVPAAPPAPQPPQQAGRKVNNIWGSVVQEQSQDQVTAGLGVFGMEGEFDMGSRNVETYNYVLARKMMAKERQEEEEKTRGRQHQEADMLDSQLEEYMQGRGSQDPQPPKRKRSAKERLGPRAQMDQEGRYALLEEDPEQRVVEELAYRLQEPKLDLLERVVRVLGRGPAIRLLEETAVLERNGGLTTLDGSRRRTPGGVYLHLLKSSPGVSRAQLRQVFLEENMEHRRSKKAAQKRRRHLVAKKMKQALNTLHLQEDQEDQEDQETFGSETLDAPASPVEEEEEEEQEEQEEQEVAVGTEETPVVYNSADLEVF